MATSRARITRARLTNNIAYFETLAAENYQIGESVTTSGCSTSALNATGTVLQSGLIEYSPSGGTPENWSGISISITNADIPVETEPATAYITSAFGVGNTVPGLID